MYHSVIVTHHEINEIANQIFRGIYLLIFAIITFVFIGVMTEQFVRTYKKALAKVYLGVANALINTELMTSHDKKRGYRKFIREKCNPYVSFRLMTQLQIASSQRLSLPKTSLPACKHRCSNVLWMLRIDER